MRLLSLASAAPRSILRSVTRSSALVPALVAAITVASGCRHAGDPGEIPEPVERFIEPHTAPTSDADAGRARFDRPAMVRFHMRRHFDDLRAIERHLIAGRLDDARALAYLLARPSADPGVAPWAPESRQVVDAALALAAAPSLDEACRREPRVSAACAGCHLRARATPVFDPPPPPPDDLPTPEARMARHLWATDWLWEAMVGGSEPAWRSGLAVLAATPLRFTRTDTSRLAGRLADLAESQGSRAITLADRAAAYGELLVTCTRCHARQRSAAR